MQMTTNREIMILTVKESTMVRPAKDTPNHCLWISNLDRLAPSLHMPSVYFYSHPTPTASFFHADLLKEALGKALVPFYPIAGRFGRDKNGRLEINCNGEGVLFVEAESSWSLDDFGDFSPCSDMLRLVPPIDYSSGIGSYPLLLLQVTYFKCGGVSLGVGIHHTVVDGASALHLINTWAEMARGLDVAVPPFLDRTLLRARDPPRPLFDHIECQPMKPLLEATKSSANSPDNNTTSLLSIFKFSKPQIDALKAKAMADDNYDKVKYTSYEVLVGHVWRCGCIARGLSKDQETSMCTFLDARTRLQPGLPPGYFGNSICKTVAIAISGDLVSKPLWYAASKVHESLVLMDNGYLRSMLDYLEMQPELPDALEILNRTESSNCSNFAVTTWARLPIYEAEFGWGRPIYMGPCFPCLPAGSIFIMPSPNNDGSLSFLVSLPPDEMEVFSRCFYDI